jgi:glycosyltransferase involved in cell wall biosynthesis
MPVSLLEAMAYGCAVIATPVGGVPDMMTPESHGLWIEPGDVAGLAAALERVARAPELRASLGAAARQHVLAEYAAATVSEKICQAYDDAMLRMRAE